VAQPVVGYLSADVVALTGVTESYLTFLVRAGIISPLKASNGRTNLFTGSDLEHIRWAVAHRGGLSIEEMRAAVLAGAA
jgi:DNA-binding transcriptional MerR regulator